MSQTAISIQNVSKKYTIGAQKDGSLRGTMAGLFSLGKKPTEEFMALTDVSFDIQKGDVVGIIGKNGAGKSTLLKILSQITKPSAGRIELNGRVASLLEVGTGFHPELSGRENVYLNGTILGMSRKEVAAKFDEIVAFSGVEKFIDTPVKHYSSGMYVRLAFAVAAHLEPEILIIDEVLAVGDAEFQKKCLGKMKDVAGEGRTVIFVSHNMGAVSTLCNRAVILKNGMLTYTGNVKDAIDVYLNESSDDSHYVIDAKSALKKPIHLSSIKPINDKQQFASDFDTNRKISLEIEFKIDIPTNDLELGVAMLDIYKNKIFTNHYLVKEKGDKIRVVYEIPANTICPGKYSFDIALFVTNVALYDYVNDVCEITVIDSGSEMFQHQNYGSVFVNCSWNVLD